MSTPGAAKGGLASVVRANERIRVLVVDDSTFMRKSLTTMLESDTSVQVVGVARNGEEAIQQVKVLEPDVVTMDVEMPGMSGIQALERVMKEHPVPVLMVSSLTTEGAAETLHALELGAVDFVAKQLDGVATKIEHIQADLLNKVKTAHQAGSKIRRSLSVKRPTSNGPGAASNAWRSTSPDASSGISSKTVVATRGSRIVAIGCSTGGPQALMEIMPMIPRDFPAGIIIVQHMPKTFTKPFAERMNNICALSVREAANGDEVKPGHVLIAPGGVQFRIKRASLTSHIVTLSPNVERHLHAPAVDIMLQSVAETFAERSIGIILTGMGHDGLEGMKAIKAANGRTIAQDEASCVVYGMPKAVVEAGCAEKVVPLSHVVGELLNMV